jgi:hypothetical protein
VPDRNANMAFVCRQNIRRYERLLNSTLTDLERDFIKKRVAEERQALESAGPEMLSRNDGDVFKTLYRVPKVVVAIFSSNFVDLLSSPLNIVEQVALF